MIWRLCPSLLSLLMFAAMALAPARAEIAVGLSVPLEGSLSLLGRQTVTGARAAVEAANANGGVNGELVTLVVVDDGCAAEQATEAAQALAEAKIVAVTGLLCFESAFALRENEALAGLPFLSLAIRLPEFTARGEPNFRFNAGPEAESDAIVEAILERWDGKPFALADDGTVYGRTLAQAVRTKLELAGRAPQLTETYRPTQNVQTGLARRLLNASVEALFVAGDGEDIAVIADSLARRGAELELLAGEAALAPFLPGSELTPPVGLLAVGPPRPEANPASEIIQQQFERAGIRGEGLVLSGYAATQTLLQALASSDETGVAAALGQGRANTILGSITFSPEGELLDRDFVLYEYSEGGFEPTTSQGDGG